MPQIVFPRPARFATALSATFLSVCLFAACEDEVLAPASGFTPSECLNGELCETGGSIDAGVRDSGLPLVVEDSGATPADSGAEPADAGVLPDSGADPLDSGVPPDSGVLPDSGAPVDAGPPPEFLNLAGTHDTEYLFDWSAYLFGIGNIAGPLDFIAQTVSGNINTGFPPLDALIRNVVQQFVPPWLVTVITVLNQVANFFEEVEVTAVMNLAQGLPLGMESALTGSETWTVMNVRLISQCPLGRQDPAYPACARQRINIVPLGRTGVGPLDVEVEVHAFAGVLQAGVPQAPFVLEDRAVDIDLYKLVTIVIDLAIRLGTNGQVQSLQQALNQIIDCAALEARAYQLAQNIGLNNTLATIAAASVRNVCDREKQNAINAVIGGLNGIGLGIVSFDYDQLGHAVDTNGNGRPETLQVMTTPDTIDGRFRLLISDPLEGEWRGINRNP